MSPDCRSHLEIAVETNSGNIPDECNVEIQSILPSILAKLGYNSFNENGEPVPASDSYEKEYKQETKKSSKSIVYLYFISHLLSDFCIFF